MSIYRSQQGVALVVALVILVVLSVLGISAVRVTVNDLQIAGDTEDSQRSFQAAEAGLAAGFSLVIDNPDTLVFQGGSNAIDFSAISPNPLDHLGSDTPVVTVAASGDPNGSCSRSTIASSADMIGCAAFELSSTHAPADPSVIKGGAMTVLRKGVTQQVISQD